ncbi:hypothetical protein [[Enterobacter] lignolyticus]|uniref:Uncharacterized protein n=1 Tax=[Enterobacter] lignolyticus TaxID=1334193 RepID=A0A806X2G5_9ENTR|nr:hypothetical protein [[Enterobacter] lignolyticus]ALR75626.1 hypothetical protein AO703_04700 [[Enterobacter] lignolyticus]
MMFFSRFQAATGGLLFLICGQAMSVTSHFQVTTVSMPAWNIITDTLIKMTPLVNGQRDDGVMSLVCDLARGDKTQQDIDEALLKKNVNLQALAKDNGTLGLLVNRDLTAQQTACSTYLISVLFTPVDNSAYMQNVPPAEKADTKNTDAAGKDDKKAKSAADTPGKSAVEKVFNQPRFEQDVRTHIAIAQATAQLYALMAGNLERMKGESWGTYQMRIEQMVREYSPNFLKTVKVFYQAESTRPIVTRSLTQYGYDISDSSYHQLIRDQHAFLFRSRSVDWLGNGVIMGKRYFVDLNILDTSAKKDTVVRGGKKGH